MLHFHKQYAKDEFSQNGEDGIIEEVIGRLKIEKGSVVEFGAHNGVFCSNSRKLILQGWKAVLIEGDPDLARQLYGLYRRPSDIQFNAPPSQIIHDVTLSNKMVLPGNVNAMLPQEIDVLSIDVDGIDYWIWEAYTGKAKVVIIEINSSLPPMSELRGDVEKGSSYRSMVELGMEKGYTLLCHCGNLIFVLDDYAHLFPEVAAYRPLADHSLFFNTSWQ